MRIKLLLAGLMAIAGMLGVAQLTGFPQMRFTAHFIGEDGTPISGVNATFVFNQDQFRRDKFIQIPVSSDASGNFTVEGYSEDGIPSTTAGLGKEGYYGGGISSGHFYKTDSLNHWLPWDATYTTVLRKIGNPIPMYAKNVNIDIPAIGQPCGYDLEVGDWVGPYGKGKVSDFIFTLQRQYQDYFDFNVSVTLTFSNPGDGIQVTQLPVEFANSQFKWPRKAPVDDYQLGFSVQFSENKKIGFHGNVPQDQVYFFRVRTVEQNGIVTSALYGKINSGLCITPQHAKNCYVGLYYYLNPTPNDRNIEYGSTLFKNLEFLETPRAP